MFSAKQAKTTKTGPEGVSSSHSSLSQPSRQFAVPAKKPNKTGMPDGVLQKMEAAFNTNFSNVKIHANSSKAPELDALAYTQGHNIHFAPGQFKPTTSEGQKIIGHELAHVVQQRKGIVRPTTKAKGLPVNDDSVLEKEADAMGASASFIKISTPNHSKSQHAGKAIQMSPGKGSKKKAKKKEESEEKKEPEEEKLEDKETKEKFRNKSEILTHSPHHRDVPKKKVKANTKKSQNKAVRIGMNQKENRQKKEKKKEENKKNKEKKEKKEKKNKK